EAGSIPISRWSCRRGSSRPRQPPRARARRALQLNPAERENDGTRRADLKYKHTDRGRSLAKTRDSFIEVMPVTSNRMATQRKIQAIQLKATGILEGLFDSQRSSRLPHSTAKLHDAMMTVADGGRCLLQHFEGTGAARRWKSAIEL